MKPSEAKQLKAGDVLATDSSAQFSRRIVVERIEVLSPAKVEVHLTDGTSRREHAVFAVTDEHTSRWERDAVEDAQRKTFASERIAVKAFFGVDTVLRGAAWGHAPDDYTVTLSRKQALEFMASKGAM